MPETSEPIPMILTCPSCCARHYDEGDFATKPHHTHACQSCGMVWRPAVVHTVGVRFLPGYKNEEPIQGRTALTPRRVEDARKTALLESRRTSYGEPGTSVPLALCNVPPKGWFCTREGGHEGPCAAHPDVPPLTREGADDWARQVMGRPVPRECTFECKSTPGTRGCVCGANARDPRCTSSECEIRDRCTGSARCPKPRST